MRTLYLSQESRFGLAVSSIHSRAENGEGDASATVVGGWGAPIARRESTFAGVREPATLFGRRKPPSEGRESRSRAATPAFHGMVLSNDGSSIINIIMNFEYYLYKDESISSPMFFKHELNELSLCSIVINQIDSIYFDRIFFLDRSDHEHDLCKYSINATFA